MSVRRAFVHAGLAAVVAAFFFGLGTYIAALQVAERDAQIDVLRADMARTLLMMQSQPLHLAGTTGRLDGVREAPVAEGLLTQTEMMEEIKRQLQTEMGLVPVQLLRDRRDSFVELYSKDTRGSSNYGTAGYLGNGYFITVKHGVVALPKPGDEHRPPRRIESVTVMYKGKALRARVVDVGDARVEVDPGDWAIIRVREEISLPPLRVDLNSPFEFADPIFRLGNDYSKGIIASTGYIGQRANGLITCLTDGHPGVSGGGVLNQNGDLIGIPVGRMQGDFRFSFILPIRDEMFRKIPDDLRPEGAAAPLETQ